MIVPWGAGVETRAGLLRVGCGLERRGYCVVDGVAGGGVRGLGLGDAGGRVRLRRWRVLEGDGIDILAVVIEEESKGVMRCRVKGSVGRMWGWDEWERRWSHSDQYGVNEPLGVASIIMGVEWRTIKNVEFFAYLKSRQPSRPRGGGDVGGGWVGKMEAESATGRMAVRWKSGGECCVRYSARRGDWWVSAMVCGEAGGRGGGGCVRGMFKEMYGRRTRERREDRGRGGLGPRPGRSEYEEECRRWSAVESAQCIRTDEERGLACTMRN
ncbi:hypothetical protein Tco_0956214 [Tanacetum coccineum]|uniref:Uncharacterized protein n=1 Tax=Tanacetum coccineum TaxID=301880 RepID=A0ABQ5E9F2_9ASTR